MFAFMYVLIAGCDFQQILSVDSVIFKVVLDEFCMPSTLSTEIFKKIISAT